MCVCVVGLSILVVECRKCDMIAVFVFFFNETATTEIYTLSLHDALPILQGRFLQQQLPFVGINNVELTKNALLIGSMKFRQRMGSVHYLTLTGNYALSASKLRYLLEQDTMFGCGIGYGLDSMFGPLEASLNYANRANKVSMSVNLGFKF